MPDFLGRTVFCIASGPSLTEQDCSLIEATGHPVIAVNSSWQRVRSAKVIFAGDQPWWDMNKKGIDIEAELWTCNMSASLKHDINLFRQRSRHWNSGLRAIELAEAAGASSVILLGYDCSVRKGTHWHGKHEKSANPTQSVCDSWKKQFEDLSRRTKIEIINCTRDTVLRCFKQMALEDLLCSKHFQVETPLKTNSNSAAL